VDCIVEHEHIISEHGFSPIDAIELPKGRFESATRKAALMPSKNGTQFPNFAMLISLVPARFSREKPGLVD
jgi:hypothetical protein